MISQFFILSPRGDTVITRDYLGNVPKVSSTPLHAALAFSELLHIPACMRLPACCVKPLHARCAFILAQARHLGAVFRL